MHAMNHASTLGSLLFSMCIAAPAPAKNDISVTGHVAGECRDITPSAPGPDPTCWNTLKMDEWIQSWMESPETRNACDTRWEPWGNCLMRLAKNGAKGIDCLNIYETDGCPLPVFGQVVREPVELWYATWSIWFIHHYLVKLALWDFYHQPEGYSANVPRIVNFLNSDAPPWVNDTGLHRLDKGVAKMMNDTWRSDTLSGDYKDDAIYNLQYVLTRTLMKWDLGDFLKLANDGGLLHSPL